MVTASLKIFLFQQILYMIVNLKRSLHFFLLLSLYVQVCFAYLKNDNYILRATKNLATKLNL